MLKKTYNYLISWGSAIYKYQNTSAILRGNLLTNNIKELMSKLQVINTIL